MEPTDLSFALRMMDCEQKRFRRKKWDEGINMSLDKIAEKLILFDLTTVIDVDCVFDYEDLMAKDWEEYKA
jgi:hypothetical protein